MGNSCFNNRPNQTYKKYFQNTNFSQLKQQWSAVQLYKIKKIFESFSKIHQHSDKPTISCQSLKQIFTEFYRYDQKHIRRIYEVFDFEQKGCIDWNNFYTFVTVCYKAPAQILSLLMFMFFDQCFSKKLNKDQLNILIDFNANYIRQSSAENEAYAYDPEQVAEILIPTNQQFISVDKWLCQSVKIFDFEKYRKFFNIFIEVKLQKQLIQNFQSWNQVFNQSEGKYVSYVIDFKWFQLFKAYSLAQYGVSISSSLKNPNNTLKTIKTLKSFRTKKTLKTINSIKSEKKIFTKSLFHHALQDSSIKNIDDKTYCKNYNLIQSHIGSRPQKMFNQELEGEYLQVLAPQLVQNMNYTLVSQKVWKKLKLIYQAYPQFRRTGATSIQLYPKRVKIYSSLFKQRLDYSTQIIREVPCFTTIEDLLKVSLQIEDLSTKFVYFKTVGMNKWEELSDLSFMFTELTSQILIFLAYFDANQSFLFKKNHCKAAQTIADVNLGDQVKYDHSKNSELKKAIYMGQTLNGKQIIHFKGSSHIYDEYVEREKFLQKASIVSRNNLPVDQIKIFPLDIPIMSAAKSYSFINSLIIMLLSNPDLKSILNQVNLGNQPKDLVEMFASLYKQSKKKIKIDNFFISDLVETHLSEFIYFQFGMIDECFQKLMQILDRNFKKISYRNVIRQNYYFTLVKKIKCLHCSDLNVYNQKCYSLNIELPQNEEKYYEFIFVPFSSTLKSLDLKKYGLKMKPSSTFKQYKAQISKLIEAQKNPFVICEVYANNIIRNFSLVKDETTLEELNIKQTDKIVVYQLCVNLGQFVTDHYTQVKDITQKKFKKGDYIDCRIKQDHWVAGKITDIEFMPYTQKTIIKVFHKSSNNSQTKKQYELNSQSMAIFPTKSYLYDNQYHLKVVQRCYNQALNEMLLSNIPLVMVLTDWMRCKQFQFMIYQQLKIFIAENYRFKDVQYEDDQCFSNTSPKFLAYKHSKKQKVKRFRDYLSSQNFPYSISLLDLNGRCLICHKIHKIVIFKGESQYYCSGCKINEQNPISWQVKLFNCMVCIDWHGLDRFRKNIVKDHKSFTDMIMNKKNDIQRLDKLLESKFTKRVLILQQQCCNFPYKTALSEEMKAYPSQLVIQIERLVDDGVNKTINRKHINFPIEELKVSQRNYFLTGVVSIEGTSPIIYKNYVSNQSQEWFQVHGQTIKKVKKNIVQKCCALFLIYNLKEMQKDQQKLSECRQSAQFVNSDQAFNSFSSQKQEKRNKDKKLTINQRLQNIDSQNEDFSYLNTQKQDQVQLDGKQDSANDSDFPPQRSSSKRSAKYVKDSKQLIKSVSQVSKASQDSRETNPMMIRLNKENNKMQKIVKQKNPNLISIQQNKKVQTIELRIQKQANKSVVQEQKQEKQIQNQQPSKNVFQMFNRFKFQHFDNFFKTKPEEKQQNQNSIRQGKSDSQQILNKQDSQNCTSNLQNFQDQENIQL